MHFGSVYLYFLHQTFLQSVALLMHSVVIAIATVSVCLSVCLPHDVFNDEKYDHAVFIGR